MCGSVAYTQFDRVDCWDDTLFFDMLVLADDMPVLADDSWLAWRRQGGAWSP